jgi:hypothetical protein
MKMRILGVLLLTALSFFAVAQTNATPTKIPERPPSAAGKVGSEFVPVKPSSGRTLTAEKTDSVIFPTVCDDKGNVYLRKGSASLNPFQGAIIRLFSDGRLSTRFEMGSVPGIDRSFVSPVWTVAADGRVIQIVTSLENGAPAQFIVQYDPDGQFRRKNELKAELRPLAIASLRSGDFLVRAAPSWEEKDAAAKTPIMAVIDFNGEIVRVWGSDPRPGAQKKGSSGSSEDDVPIAFDGALVVDKEGLVWTLQPG